ncbi:MAG: dTMP kinase [Candidatus Zixiibacteriota bacterium]|nr:MAG: dTMP kinase [candidate division Zixibacteria bacterium]
MSIRRTSRRPLRKTKKLRLFVTFEGIDGSGKSTQLWKAARFLRAQGYRVKTLREPGSTGVSERIRRILLDRRATIAPTTELLLYAAARAEIVRREIAPALKRGEVVLCDRFYDSTTTYQGYGRGLDMRAIKTLHRMAVGDTVPDLTFVLDVDLKTASARRSKKPDRLESESRLFHNRVRRGFREIAKKESRRVKLVDGSRHIDDIFEDVRSHLVRRLSRK